MNVLTRDDTVHGKEYVLLDEALEAVAAERERCAKLCERQDWPDSESDYLAGCEFAKRIRA